MTEILEMNAINTGCSYLKTFENTVSPKALPVHKVLGIIIWKVVLYSQPKFDKSPSKPIFGLITYTLCNIDCFN